jgi:hypothetical protein
MNDIIKQIQQEYRIANDGSVTLSIRGVARLAGVEHSSLIRQFSTSKIEGGALSASKLAEFLVTQGVAAGVLNQFSSAGIPDTTAALIIEYYAYECQPRYRSQQAKQCCRAFMTIGIRTWIQREAGWSQEPIQATKPELETTLPTEEEMNYLRSRDWEKKELAAIDAGQTPNYRTLRQEFGNKSGFTRAQRTARTYKRELKIWNKNQKQIEGSGD